MSLPDNSEVAPIKEYEKEQIWHETDSFGEPAKHGYSLHFHPNCDVEYRRQVPSAIYPVGYHELCEVCLRHYRQDGRTL